VWGEEEGKTREADLRREGREGGGSSSGIIRGKAEFGFRKKDYAVRQERKREQGLIQKKKKGRAALWKGGGPCAILSKREWPIASRSERNQSR